MVMSHKKICGTFYFRSSKQYTICPLSEQISKLSLGHNTLLDVLVSLLLHWFYLSYQWEDPHQQWDQSYSRLNYAVNYFTVEHTPFIVSQSPYLHPSAIESGHTSKRTSSRSQRMRNNQFFNMLSRKSFFYMSACNHLFYDLIYILELLSFYFFPWHSFEVRPFVATWGETVAMLLHTTD